MISFTEPVFYHPGDRILTHMAANRDGCFAVLKAKDEAGGVKWRAMKEVSVHRLKVPPSASYDEYAKTFIERAEETWGMPFVPWVEDGDLVPTYELSTIAMLEDKVLPERPLTHHDVKTYLIGKAKDLESCENIARGWLEGRRISWVQKGRSHAVRYIVDQAFQAYGRKEPPASEIERHMRDMASNNLQQQLASRQAQMQQDMMAQYTAQQLALNAYPQGQGYQTPYSKNVLDQLKGIEHFMSNPSVPFDAQPSLAGNLQRGNYGWTQPAVIPPSSPIGKIINS